MTKYLLILVFILFAGCRQNSQTQQANSDLDTSVTSGAASDDSTLKSYQALNNIVVNSVTDTSQYYTVDTICAVAISPDSTWFNEQQKSMPEDEWSTVVDDHQYYQSSAEDSLEANGIKIYYRLNERRYLKFKKQNGQEFTIDRQKKKDMWGLILFNGNDDPVFWEDVDIEGALKDIYKKRK